jgi:TonB family protein
MRLALGATLAVVLLSAVGADAQTTESAQDRFHELAAATQMDRKGASPFHLKMDAQLYRLDGKAAGQGTIEEWWLSPDEYRIEINSGPLHKVVATGDNAPAPPPADRDSYLLDQLLSETVHPLFERDARFVGKEAPTKFGKVELSCFQLISAMGLAKGQPPKLVCCDPGNGVLLAQVEDPEAVLRKSLATFRGVQVALETAISYSGRTAVSGKVTTLQVLEPGAPGVPPLKPDSAGANSPPQGPVGVKSGVLAGRLLHSEPPHYPEASRAAHIQGAVLLHGVITKEGSVGSIFVIASPDEVLSHAAIAAVKNWTYQPYLLNGQPVEVDTSFRVNFNLN